jgi:hypothetical protein
MWHSSESVAREDLVPQRVSGTSCCTAQFECDEAFTP